MNILGHVQELWSNGENKKFKTAMMMFLLAVGCKFILRLDDQTIVTCIIAPLGLYVIGQGIADAGKSMPSMTQTVSAPEATSFTVTQPQQSTTTGEP